MEAEDRVVALREAGSVERAHTTPHHGSYSVAKHSWDAACLLLVLHPEPSIELLKAVLWHDVGERWTGDVPATAKWADGELARRLDQLEQRCMLELGINQVLSAEERTWLAAVDAIELYLWATDQVNLGNQCVTVILDNLEVLFGRIHLPEPCALFMKEHYWRRMPDGIPGTSS